MPQNLIEKIVQKYALDLEMGQKVQSGDLIAIAPEYILTHDNTAAVMTKFKAMGATRIYNTRQPVFALDHNVQDTRPETLKKYGDIETFAREMGVDFYPSGRGIGHQIMCEEGYAWPGTMVVASDSHANMYGGLGALGTPLVRSDAAAIWATGQTWWQVPPVVRVNLQGTLKPGVSGKDVIITLAGHFNQDEVLNHAIEFAGDELVSLDMDARLTIANMTTEWGALAAVFPLDGITYTWLENQAVRLEKRGLSGVSSDVHAVDGRSPRMNFGHISELKLSAPYPDPDAIYEKEITLDLGSVSPSVSGPDHVKSMNPASLLEKENIEIHKAYLLSCVNGRVADLADAAEVIRGKQVADDVELYVAAASSEVQAESEARGDWQTLIDAGAIILPSGCGPCIGLGVGLLGDNEVGISATNRNFKGRMGARSAVSYLASPAVVAASAVAGKIVSAIHSDDESIVASIQHHEKPAEKGIGIALLAGFPESIEGRLVFCHEDNLNTDGIYPGKYTYEERLSTTQMAGHVMENYDPEFGRIVEVGDVLVGGFNFGTGSSREQAATALKYAGVSLVLAGSFSETYKRNAINNGFLVLEAPDLLHDLIEIFGRDQLTLATTDQIRIDFKSAILAFRDNTYALRPVGAAAQELVISNGLENWVKERI